MLIRYMKSRAVVILILLIAAFALAALLYEPEAEERVFRGKFIMSQVE